MENEEFKLAPSAAVSSPASDGFTADDFKLVQADSSIHDTRMAGKSTTYFKDIVRRFVKNKTSVFGFCLFGLLLVITVICSFAIPGEVGAKDSSPQEQYLPPKLFPAGTGFWDGTTKYVNRPYDTENQQPQLKVQSSTIVPEGIVGDVEVFQGTINSESEYGHGGQVEVRPGYWLATPSLKFNFNSEGKIIDTLSVTLNIKSGLDTIYAGYADPTYSFSLQLTDDSGESIGTRIALEDLSDLSKTGDGLTYDLTAALNALDKESFQYDETVTTTGADGKEKTTTETFTATSGRIVISASNSPIFITDYSLAGDATYIPNGGDPAALSSFAITDACQTLWTASQFEGTSPSASAEYAPQDGEKMTVSNWWTRTNSSSVSAFGVSTTLCNFTYNPYEAVYGLRPSDEFSIYASGISSDLVSQWKSSGWVTYDTDANGVPLSEEQTVDGETVDVVTSFRILDHDKVSLIADEEHPVTITSERILGNTYWSLHGTIEMFREFGYKSMPYHIFGTDMNGRDFLKLISRGMLYSLGIGVAISAICFLFGLAWGSFSGYQGGVIDLAMERIVDILSYIPGMVLITLFILNWGHTFWVFMLAMCVTGWIGTSALTRTQFYRFKRREYVLASRSLGASDGRLIYRHILPNGLGTIITSSVLMVPSVIYSEASLAYLGLGLQDVTSLGTIIENNQSNISSIGSVTDRSYLIIIPSILLALILICFELFGQGLRDAVNPNLKGTDE